MINSLIKIIVSEFVNTVNCIQSDYDSVICKTIAGEHKSFEMIASCYFICFTPRPYIFWIGVVFFKPLSPCPKQRWNGSSAVVHSGCCCWNLGSNDRKCPGHQAHLVLGCCQLLIYSNSSIDSLHLRLPMRVYTYPCSIISVILTFSHSSVWWLKAWNNTYKKVKMIITKRATHSLTGDIIMIDRFSRTSVSSLQSEQPTEMGWWLTTTSLLSLVN